MIEQKVIPRWYCVANDGAAMLCKDKHDAETEARELDELFPGNGPHVAVLLGEVEGLTGG